MTGHFADRLLEAVEVKHSHVVVGLDPDYALLPAAVKSKHQALVYPDNVERVVGCYREFLLGVLEQVEEAAVAVKLQVAFFEALGHRGFRLYEEIARIAADRGLIVIADVKRGDIGTTAEAYARAYLDVLGVDAVTVNPWFGSDGMEPFLARARERGKGVLVLVKTSNVSSAELQDRRLATGEAVYEMVAKLVSRWAEGSMGKRGYSCVGAVVGGTHPAQARGLRRALPGVPFLVPGYGAQGATAGDLAGVFDAAGTGTVVNAARSILYAYRTRGGAWPEAIRAEAQVMREELWRAAGRA